MIAKLLKIVLLSLIMLLSFSTTVLAEETKTGPNPDLYDWYIENFNSEINVLSARDIEVQEMISVNFLVPKHGIYRTIPYRYQDDYGQGRSIFLNIDGVTDERGNKYQYTNSYSGGGLTLKIGDPNTTVSGKMTYLVRYHLSNVLNYFADDAEFYFNVNGNGWDVPTKKVSAKVILPQNGQPKAKKFYLGLYGNVDTEGVKETGNLPLEISAENLAPGEGLTLVVRFDQRLVPKPGFWIRAGWMLKANGIYFLPIFVLILLLFLLLKYGKDPFGQGTIAPQFEPPKDLSVIDVGAIADERVDNRDMTATIIHYAVSGYLKIKEIKKKGIFSRKDYELEKLKEFSIEGDEKYIFDQIFGSNRIVKLSEIGKDGKLAKARNEVQDRTYKALVKKKFFSRNPQVIKGIYITIGIVLIFSVFILPAFVERYFTIATSVISLVASAILFFVFAKYMPQRTREGVLLKEQIEGFKLYLTTAEKFRMKFYEKSGIFEKYLPYAIALNVADIWAKKFEDKYRNLPDWYQGNYRTFSLVYFSHSLSSDFSTSVHSAFATAPAASGHSGFSSGSGGGFSGGGFGGGGGGSW